jgi:hypothetical protein
MFGKVKAAAFAVSSPTSALWADSEKPIDTDAPSSKRQEARTSPARRPGCAPGKCFLAKSTFNRLHLAKLLMRSLISPGLADVRQVNAPLRTAVLRSIMVRLLIIGQHCCAWAFS